ncbi:hypothetical protein CCHL11_02773, partial [Colletotrichum chlorophyti]
YKAVSYILEIGNTILSFSIRDYVIVPNTVSVDYIEIELTLKEYFSFSNMVFKFSDSIAVFRAGSIRLLSAYLAILYRASKVYIVNYVKERLGLTASIGAIPINFIEEDPIT